MTSYLQLASVLRHLKEKYKYGIYIRYGKNTSTAEVASFIEKNFDNYLQFNDKAHISLKGKGYKIAFQTEEARDEAINKYKQMEQNIFEIDKLMGQTFEPSLAPVDFYDLPVEDKDFHKVLTLLGDVAYTKISYKKQAKNQPPQSTLTAYFTKLSKLFVEIIQKGRSELIEGQKGYFRPLWKNKCKRCSTVGHNEHQCPMEKEKEKTGKEATAKKKKKKKDKSLTKKKKTKTRLMNDKDKGKQDLNNTFDDCSSIVQLSWDSGEQEKEDELIDLTMWLNKESNKAKEMSTKKKKKHKKKILETLENKLGKYDMTVQNLEEKFGIDTNKMFLLKKQK